MTKRLCSALLALSTAVMCLCACTAGGQVSGLRRAAFREFQRAGALLGVPVCAGAAAAARAGNARYRDRPVGEPPHRAC